MKIISVVGARPNFMKIAPFIRANERHNQSSPNRVEHLLVHTGQHYDDRMSRAFFDDLGIPQADINLGVGSGSHAEQVGQTMIAFEKVLKEQKPDWVVVVGDVNATLACSVTAKKEGIKCCHIEAGLRSGDMKMPEEINRLVTDRLCDLLLTPDELSSENLRREGTEEKRIVFVGNIMIDTLENSREKSSKLNIEQIISKNRLALYNSNPPSPSRASGGQSGQQATGNREIPPTPVAGRPTEVSAEVGRLSPESFALLTLHRPSNVDHREVLEPLVRFITDEVCSDMPLIWTLHPRTRKMLLEFGLFEDLLKIENLILLEPLGYHEMLKLNMNARILLTDSGGLQEECTVLGTPCLTLRWNTERPVTLKEHGGASVLVGNNIERIREEYLTAIRMTRKPYRPPLWDGQTAKRCLNAILAFKDKSKK